MTYDDGIPFGLPPLTTQACARIARTLRDDRTADTDWYAAYLSSEVWQRTRELALEHYGATCCLCNTPATRLDVHHRTYSRLGHERLADLTVLCRNCHARHHIQAA